ncbi:hypothetical protein KAR91_31405 [Candidatus Pacearchaeota archaeon]|nr:hypothetical protein [Candidatus Pacearchaeota archaeon]
MEKTNKETATIILNQLGGRRFLAMTGAKNLVCDNNALMFKFPRCGPEGEKSNFCEIRLNSLDLYDIKFKRIHGIKIIDVSEHNGIYADMLQNIFRKQTGLETSL